MARKRALSVEELPTIESLVERNMKRGQRMMENGRTPQEVANILESRSMVVRQFLMQNFEMIETDDKELLEKSGKIVLKSGLASVASGFGLNYGLSRLRGGWIYDRPLWMRVGVRSLVFIAPVAFAFQYCYTRYMHVSLYLEDKYADRIAMYMRSGDPSSVNPKGV
mmetsp:Transcript_827/g.1826  ORF Transcript_827/g.1826 Transcript_827/m.1826 type:complete len:166 (+) Transcript_827:3036-3533(+)